jgi:hypothetical protein
MRQGCTKDSREMARTRRRRRGPVPRDRAAPAFFVAFAFPAILLGACNPEPASSPLLGIDPEQDILSAAEHLPTAIQESNEWRSSAQLIWIDIDIAKDSAEVAYAFDNPNDPEDGLLVYLEPSGDGYSIRTKEVISEGRKSVRPPIEQGDWVVDSIEIGELAFQRARGFLLEHPEVAQMDMQLAGLSGSSADHINGEAGDLVWSVMFYSSPGTSLDLYYDPLTGEFLGEILREG